MGGSNTVPSGGGQPGVYGTFGMSAAGNDPGGRDGTSFWMDSSGNLWLFGGYGYDANGAVGLLNDLWKYQPIAPSQAAAARPFRKGQEPTQ
jgi:hypothetical protein